MALEHLRCISYDRISAAEWNAAADDFRSAWFWHRKEAIDAYATWEATVNCSLAILDDSSGGRIVALLPLYCTRRRGIIGNMLARLESTGGPAVADDLTHKQRRNVEFAISDHLINTARRLGAYRIDISAPPLAPAHMDSRINPLVSLGCHDTSTQSWIIDLRGAAESELWSRVDHRVRKTVNKARRHSITIRDANADDLSAYLALHDETCRRNEIAPKPPGYFEAIFGNIWPLGNAIILMAENTAGAALAFHVFAVYKKRALYWTVASGQDALKTGTNDLLQWTALLRFLTLGVEFYETGEAFPGLKSGKLQRINEFKKGFGGSLHPYFRGSIITRPILSSGLDLLRSLRTHFMAKAS